MTRRHTGLSLIALAAAAVAGIAVGAETQVTAPADTAGFLSLGEIQSRLTSRGIDVKEIVVRDKVLEIEGYNKQGQEVDLIVDRRTGETLSERLDD